MCKNGQGYDEGGRCVPLKPFPKKLVEEVAALAVAGVWLLVQVCAFLNNCCCAKKGKDDKKKKKDAIKLLSRDLPPPPHNAIQ